MTVVVPCRDRPQQLRTCLAALSTSVREHDEVIVVDSASRDDAVAAAAQGAGVRLVRCDIAGASRARNAGWQAAAHRHVAFTDDDIVVSAGWLDALASGFTDGRVGFTTGRTVASSTRGARGQAVSVTVVEPPVVITFGTRGVYGASNNLAVRADALAAVGGFDERLGPGRWLSAGEDLELLDRVLAAGWTGRYVADAVVSHEQWRTRRELRRIQWSYGKGMGARLAALARRDPHAAWALRHEAIRLEGVQTALRRLSPRRAAATPTSIDTTGAEARDDSGWAGPLLWRAGALVGAAAGLVVLRPDGPANDAR